MVCACLLNGEGCKSFHKHLDLVLAPNKTNEGVKKQWNNQQCDKSWHIVTCLVTFILGTFSFCVLAAENRKRRDVRVLTAA